MKSDGKLLCMLAIGGLVALAAAPEALATQSQNGTSKVSVTLGESAKTDPNTYAYTSNGTRKTSDGYTYTSNGTRKTSAALGESARTDSNSYPGKHPSASRDDGDLKSDVKRAVDKYKDVSVSVDDGIVELSGQVANEADRKNAVEAARDVSGVRTVHDQLQVAGSGSQSIGEFVDDSGITAAVKSKLLTEESLSPFKISVDTIDGVVTLTGEVTSKELADNAGRTASQVKGVKRVDNKLLVKP